MILEGYLSHILVFGIMRADRLIYLPTSGFFDSDTLTDSGEHFIILPSPPVKI